MTFSRNLSFISQPWLRVAAMVVSEMMERLSPNMAPERMVPAISTGSMPVAWATPRATGATAPMVPIEVPMAVAMKAEMRKSPGSRNQPGIRERPRATVASTPPVALATVAKAPASR